MVGVTVRGNRTSPRAARWVKFVQKKIKETAEVYRKQTFSNIRNEQGQVAQDDAQKKVIWEQGIANLFADERSQLEDNPENNLSGRKRILEKIFVEWGGMLVKTYNNKIITIFCRLIHYLSSWLDKIFNVDLKKNRE